MTAGHGALYYSIFAVSIDAMGNETVTGGSIHRERLSAPAVAHAIRDLQAPLERRSSPKPQAELQLVPADTSSRALRPLPSIHVPDDHTGALAWSRPVTTIEGLAISRRMVVALVWHGRRPGNTHLPAGDGTSGCDH